MTNQHTQPQSTKQMYQIMQGEEQKTTLPKLLPDGANWVTYCDRLHWALDSGRLHKHIQLDTVPTLYTTAGTIGGISADDRWAKEEGQVRMMIGNSIPDSAFNKIKSQTTVKAIYDTLKTAYEDRSKALVADLMRRFRNKRCKDNESVRSHFEELANLREQLAAMGKSVTDTDYLDTLLASLPTSYEQACVAISASARLGAKDLTAEIFEQYILDESEQRVIKTGNL